MSVSHGVCVSLQAPVCLCNLARQVEEGTPFARWYTGENTPLPKEPDAVAMFELASALLTGAGYEHYEVWFCVLTVR